MTSGLEQRHRSALRFNQLRCLLVERSETITAEPFAFEGDRAIGKVATGIKNRQSASTAG